MFGYLRVQSCGLEDQDRALYRSHFCSVCHHLHQFSGWDSSLLTNYDITLWSLVASGVSAESYAMPMERRPCTAFPLSRVGVQPLAPRVGASLAAITVLLVAAKLEDCAQDGQRLVSGLGKAWLGKREAKAESYLRSQGYPLENLLELPRRQQAAEGLPHPKFAHLSSPTEGALSDAFFWIGALSERGDLEVELRTLGEAIARYVYLWDALEDLPKDRKSGDFNAILATWGESFSRSLVKRELLDSLLSMEEQLRDLPLGNRRPLCLELVKTLQGRVNRHELLRGVSARPRDPRRGLRRAGFVTTSCDCDCGCDSCCEVGCCDTDCGGSCCEVGCCDLNPGDSCCELHCCSFDACGCCCCGDSAEESTSCCCSSCCWDSTEDVLCCCWGDDTDRGRSRGLDGIKEHSSSSGRAEEAPPMCPGCRRDMGRQPSSSHRRYFCHSCSGTWLDRDDLARAADEGSLPVPSGAAGGPPIGRGQRMCPRCNSLLRSPSDPTAPESCESCGGRFYCG